MRLLLSLLAFTAALGAAAAAPPDNMCANQPAQLKRTPFALVENGMLVQLLDRKLSRPVPFAPGQHRDVVLLHSARSILRFPYPGELDITQQGGATRIVHNHHVSTTGEVSPALNGWWLIELLPSGRHTALGFTTSRCYFRWRYQP